MTLADEIAMLINDLMRMLCDLLETFTYDALKDLATFINGLIACYMTVLEKIKPESLANLIGENVNFLAQLDPGFAGIIEVLSLYLTTINREGLALLIYKLVILISGIITRLDPEVLTRVINNSISFLAGLIGMISPEVLAVFLEAIISFTAKLLQRLI